MLPWELGGDAIPARGALYLDASRWATSDFMVTSDGGVRWSASRVNDQTVRINYDAGGGATELSVHVPRGAPVVHRVDAAWQAPAAAPHMVRVWRRPPSEPSWCGDADGLSFQVNQPVMAMHVTLLSSTGARLERTLLPYGYVGEALGSYRGVVRLRPDELDDADRAILADRWLAHLRAIYADGTEVDVGGSPVAVGAEVVPILSSETYDAVGLVPPASAPQTVASGAAASLASPTTSPPAAQLLAVILGLSLTAGALSWRLRIRPPRPPDSRRPTSCRCSVAMGCPECVTPAE